MKALAQKHIHLQATHANGLTETYKRVCFFSHPSEKYLIAQPHSANTDRHNLECKSL